MKRVLMIAYLFPPVGGIGSAGSQRVLKFAKYLMRCQWKPIILTVREQDYESYFALDQSLLKKVPLNLVVIRTSVTRWLSKILQAKQTIRSLFSPIRVTSASSEVPASDRAKDVGDDRPQSTSWYQRLKDSVTDLFELPDEEMGWFIPAFLNGIRAIRRENVDVIYSTGRPWTAHVIGVALKKLTGTPLVVDFRDPWMTNPFRLKYSPLKERLESYLERKVIEEANLVIANTEELKEELLKRFPQQPQHKFVSILNGFDPDDYPVESKAEQAVNGHFTVTHTGFLYGRRDPKMFLEAIKLLMERGAIDHKNFRVRLVGTVELPYNLAQYLSESKLDTVVSLHDQVPYHTSLEYLQHSDLLLLLQPGTKTQVPSKLFEYIGMRKPILAISPRDGATSVLVEREGVGMIADPDKVQEIAESLLCLYRQWSQGLLSNARYECAYKKFNVQRMTADLAGMLHGLVSRESGN
jgi:glycosyltransferase involved in cell wall biosynthesis